MVAVLKGGIPVVGVAVLEGGRSVVGVTVLEGGRSVVCGGRVNCRREL